MYAKILVSLLIRQAKNRAQINGHVFRARGVTARSKWGSLNFVLQKVFDINCHFK